jgi:hypothetical protein
MTEDSSLDEHTGGSSVPIELPVQTVQLKSEHWTHSVDLAVDTQNGRWNGQDFEPPVSVRIVRVVNQPKAAEE